MSGFALAAAGSRSCPGRSSRTSSTSPSTPSRHSRRRSSSSSHNALTSSPGLCRDVERPSIYMHVSHSLSRCCVSRDFLLELLTLGIKAIIGVHSVLSYATYPPLPTVSLMTLCQCCTPPHRSAVMSGSDPAAIIRSTCQPSKLLSLITVRLCPREDDNVPDQ